MKRSASVLVLICVAVMALGSAGASAAPQFTYSATGTLEGSSESNQVFTAAEGGPAVVCTSAHVSGTITSVATTYQTFTVEYTGCSIPALFNAPVDNIMASYGLNANGTVEIEKAVVITSTGLGCSTTIAAGQTVGTITYTNVNSNTELTFSMNLGGIHSTSTGLCPSGTTGVLTGNDIFHRVGGGFYRWDP